VYFYERGIQLLREGGVFSFISSNKWFRSAYGGPLRGWLARHTRLHQIIDFGDAPVFTSIAYPSIVILTKEGRMENRVAERTSTNEIRILNWQPGPPVEQFVDIFRQQSFPLPQASLKPDGWRLESGVKLKLLERIRTTGTSLGEYANGRFYWGIKTGLNEAFVIDHATRDRLIAEHPSSLEIIKPWLRGRDIKRWRIDNPDLFLCYIGWRTEIENYPAICKHLSLFSDRLKARPEVKAGIVPWYALSRYASEYWQEFEQPKILIPAISDTMNFAPDWHAFYSNNKTSICVPPSIPIALAVANSQISFWLAQQTFATKQGGFYDFEPRYSSQIRIPPTTAQQEKSISYIVDYMVWLNRREFIHRDQVANNRDPLMLGYFEQLLNGLVYELFFPDELHAQKLFFFRYAEEAKLPALGEIPEAKCLAVLRETFERISDLNHPLRGCLFSLGALETVRIIEGEA
jgi:hypothetical protein